MTTPYNLTILPSTALTATYASAPIESTPPFSSAQICINVSAFTSGSITPHIQGQDPVSGSWYDILVGSSISATGLTVLTVGKGVTVAANVSASTVLPDGWRVQLVAGAGTALTASVGVNAGI